MEEETPEQYETAGNDLDPDRPRRNLSNARAYKQQPQKKAKKKPKYIVDPTNNQTYAFPGEKLPLDVTQRRLVQRVNTLQELVHIQSSVLADVREWFSAKRREKEVDSTAVALLAARGNSKYNIATLLGFDVDAFNKRKELQQAFDIGRAEISDALSTKQLSTAFNEKGMPATTMQIFLGKVLLGQRDGSGSGQSSVNVQINNDTGSGGALREKIRLAREQAQAGKQEWDSTVTTIDSQIVDDSVVAQQDVDSEKV